MQHNESPAEVLLGLVVLLVVLAVGVVLGWVLPIMLGVRAAKAKNYSPLWMLFGIHPVGGWIACIVMLCLAPRLRCSNCGGFVSAQFRMCPYCHVALGPPIAPAPPLR